MVAERVEEPSIDGLVQELWAALERTRAARSDAQRVAREAVAVRLGDALQAAMRALEATIVEQRDWLDANRMDKRYARRRAAFVGETLRQHAAAGEALERAAGMLTWRS